MPAIPPFVLKKLYLRGSLRSEAGGFSLCLKNVIAPGSITGISGMVLDGQNVDIATATVTPAGGEARTAGDISREAPLQFPLGSEVTLSVAGEPLEPGAHRLTIRVIVRDVGPLEIPISDTLE